MSFEKSFKLKKYFITNEKHARMKETGTGQCEELVYEMEDIIIHHYLKRRNSNEEK